MGVRSISSVSRAGSMRVVKAQIASGRERTSTSSSTTSTGTGAGGSTRPSSRAAHGHQALFRLLHIKDTYRYTCACVGLPTPSQERNASQHGPSVVG